MADFELHWSLVHSRLQRRTIHPRRRQGQRRNLLNLVLGRARSMAATRSLHAKPISKGTSVPPKRIPCRDCTYLPRLSLPLVRDFDTHAYISACPQCDATFTRVRVYFHASERHYKSSVVYSRQMPYDVIKNQGTRRLLHL